MQYDAVALSALAILATCVGLMVWVVKKVLGEIAPAMQKHSKSADGLQKAVEKNTQSNEEMLTFMRKLNGKLPKLIDEKKKQATREK